MLERRKFQNDLNTRTNNLVSFPVSGLILAAPFSLRFHWIGIVVLLMIVLLIALNYPFLSFLFRRKGARFTLGALAMTWFAYLYCGLSVLIGLASYVGRRLGETSRNRGSR